MVNCVREVLQTKDLEELRLGSSVSGLGVQGPGARGFRSLGYRVSGFKGFRVSGSGV